MSNNRTQIITLTRHYSGFNNVVGSYTIGDNVTDNCTTGDLAANYSLPGFLEVAESNSGELAVYHRKTGAHFELAVGVSDKPMLVGLSEIIILERV